MLLWPFKVQIVEKSRDAASQDISARYNSLVFHIHLRGTAYCDCDAHMQHTHSFRFNPSCPRLHRTAEQHHCSWIDAQIWPSFPQLPIHSLSDTEPNCLSVLWPPVWRAHLLLSRALISFLLLKASTSEECLKAAVAAILQEKPCNIRDDWDVWEVSLCRTFPHPNSTFFLCHYYLMALVTWKKILRCASFDMIRG